MRRLLAIAALLACPPADGQKPAPDFSLAGKWTWVLTEKALGSCEETWDFQTDDGLVAVSGQERLEKSYALEITGPGTAWLTTIVTATNRKPDCIGKTSAKVGTETKIFLRRQEDGRILTCFTEQPQSCIGELRRSPTELSLQSGKVRGLLGQV